jgi:DnaJ-class molecular chaperone
MRAVRSDNGGGSALFRREPLPAAAVVCVQRDKSGRTTMDDIRAAGDTDGRPGDQADPGIEGTGEALCPVCGGSGRIDGADCEKCGGTGKIVEGIGGA